MHAATYKELRETGKIPWHRDHVRKLCKARKFPKPIVLSRTASGKPTKIMWLIEEVDASWAALKAERELAASTAPAAALIDRTRSGSLARRNRAPVAQAEASEAITERTRHPGDAIDAPEALTPPPLE
jgi:hypothetical protein